MIRYLKFLIILILISVPFVTYSDNITGKIKPVSDQSLKDTKSEQSDISNFSSSSVIKKRILEDASNSINSTKYISNEKTNDKSVIDMKTESSEFQEKSTTTSIDNSIDNTSNREKSTKYEDSQDISTWQELIDAAKNKVPIINLMKNITATDYTSVDISTNTIINGNGFTLDFSKQAWPSARIVAVIDNLSISLNNINLTKYTGDTNLTTQSAIISSSNNNFNTTINLSGEIDFPNTNRVGFIYDPNGTINISNASIKGGSSKDNAPRYGFVFKNLNIINSSFNIDQTESPNANAILYSDRESSIKIDNSIIDLKTSGNSNRSFAIYTKKSTSLDVKNNSKIDINGNWNDTGGDKKLGLVTFSDTNQSINNISINSGSSLNISNNKNTAIAQNSINSTFKIDNATVKINGNSSRISPLIKYLSSSNQNKIWVTNMGKLEIKNSIKDTPTWGASPNSIEFYGSNNSLDIDNCGTVDIDNSMYQTSPNSGVDGSNFAAIKYNSGDNTLNINDGTNSRSSSERTRVSITSDYSSAIFSTGGKLTVNQKPNTIFNAVGNSANNTQFGTFVGDGSLFININAPYYYDFRNIRLGGGEIFGTHSGNLTIENTMFSAWSYRDDMQGPGSYNTNNKTIINYKDRDFSQIGEEMDSIFGKILPGLNKDVKRISANNAASILTGVRRPTTADKRIIMEFAVPQGDDAILSPAGTDEVHVSLMINHNDSTYDLYTGSTIGYIKDDPLNPGFLTWEESANNDIPKSGRVNILLKDYLEKNDKIFIKDIWRGNEDPNSPSSIHTDISKINQNILIPAYVDPPALISLDDVQDINEGDTEINIPASKNNIPGQAVTLYKNGFPINNSIIKNDGSIFIKLPDNSIKAGDKLKLITNDNTGTVKDTLSTLSSKFLPPQTNNSLGNFNPLLSDYTYHDKIFKTPKELVVKASQKVSLVSVPKSIGFKTAQIISASNKTYKLDQANGDLIVKDPSKGKNKWKLTASINQGFISEDGIKLDSGNFFYNNGKTKDYFSDHSSVKIIDNNDLLGNIDINISSEWLKDSGIYINVPAGSIKSDKYNGIITWSLNDVP